MSNKKLVLVIGATGAQGLVVVDALLAPSSDGSPSPYAVRALTRDPESRRAKELSAKGVELAIGRFDDFVAVRKSLQGCWGAFINTDGFTVGEERETYAAMRIFELAKQTPTLRHYVWSNLDYVFKKGGYKDDYRTGHYDGKGRIAEWLTAQPTSTDPEQFMWSVLTTGPYMDMLHFGMFGPRAIREDGTREFIAPVGEGHVPMIALADLGWWARYTFDAPRELLSGQDLEVAGEMVSWEDLVATFTRVSGLPAVYIPVTVDQWMDATPDTHRPAAADHIRAGRTDVTTFRENFSGFWRVFRDDVIKRDMQWIRRVYPRARSLEDWMRENKYTGETKIDVLKGVEEGPRALWKKVADESKL